MTVCLGVPELVFLAGGSFVMGNDTGRADEQPSHGVTLPAFRAAVRPVSNAEYLAFVEAAGCERPPFVDDERFADPQQPVVGVSWHDAEHIAAGPNLTQYLARPAILGAEYPHLAA